MKILKIALLFFFGSITVYAQDLKMDEVPAKVVSTFEKEFLKANDVAWEKDKNNYKVAFKRNQMDYEVWYSSTEKEVKREVELLKSQLPKAVTKTLNKKYAAYKTGDAKMIKRASKKTLYRVEIEKENLEKIITFDENGSVLGVRTNR
ncbi:PepSY-like domain-containing protein [Mesonia ostreae]|uniref:PepSY-like domain-containing protein n=1 Tax=Mesonia ostreae TaxID=861110 RepID=A0ABU2KI25_9FLAO|nr:PepSY-like domain-containing protein [Mesonia ostreae]MDT0294342.1 PepSY-like domain-containing protein [Mesonia ostreae]